VTHPTTRASRCAIQAQISDLCAALRAAEIALGCSYGPGVDALHVLLRDTCGFPALVDMLRAFDLPTPTGHASCYREDLALYIARACGDKGVTACALRAHLGSAQPSQWQAIDIMLAKWP